MELDRLFVVFDDISSGFYRAFARCRGVGGLALTPAELVDAQPHVRIVGAYPRPDLCAIVATYKVQTVRLVEDEQTLEMVVHARVDQRCAGASSGAPASALQALQQKVDEQIKQQRKLEGELNTLKRKAGPTPSPPPGAPGGGGQQLAPLQQGGGQQQRQQQGGAQPHSPATGQAIPTPVKPASFDDAVGDPLELVKRYEWVVHEAGGVPGCGWVALFDACKTGPAPPADSRKRPCPRCAAGLTQPDKAAVVSVAASNMSQALRNRVAAVVTGRGW